MKSVIRLLANAVAILAFGSLACGSLPPMAELEAPVATPTIIRNTRLFVGEETAAIPGQDVWIENGLISRVEPTGAKEIPSDALVIDGAGRTLLPGLIDAHVHVSNTDSVPWDVHLPNPKRNLEKFLYAGITTVLDTGGGAYKLRLMRRDLRNGSLVGPDLLMSGQAITALGGHPAAMFDILLPWPLNWFFKRDKVRQVTTDEEVDAALDELTGNNVDWIKLMLDDIPLDVPELTDTLVERAVQGAHKRGRKVAVHIGADRDARLAAQKGADMLAHNVYRDAYTPETLALMAEKGVAVTVTVGVFDNADNLAYADYKLPTYLPELVDPAQRKALENRPKDIPIAEMKGWLEAVHTAGDVRLANARALGANGIAWMVGSDSPNVGWTPGLALHQEMELLVQAGYTPGEVLRAATAGNAGQLALTDRGVVAKGMRADLLLVEGAPDENIADIHRIVEVFKVGRRVMRAPQP